MISKHIVTLNMEVEFEMTQREVWLQDRSKERIWEVDVMAIVKWEPFGGLLSFASFLPDLDDFLPRMNAWPSMDVYSDGEDLIVKMEVPEMRPDEVSITLNDGYIRVAGHHEHEEQEDTKEYYRKERFVGSFTREIPLPKEVGEGEVKAKMANGLLEIRINTAVQEVAAAKRIPIEAGEDTGGHFEEGSEAAQVGEAEGEEQTVKIG
jgi:HSP20 family protein